MFWEGTEGSTYKKKKDDTHRRDESKLFDYTSGGKGVRIQRTVGSEELQLDYLWKTSLWDSADKWAWKERLGACRRFCFSLLIWTSILMGHLTLIQKLDLESHRAPPSAVTLLPEQGNGKPLRASKMHYLCSSVCSAFSPVARLIVSIVPYWPEQFEFHPRANVKAHT